MLCFTEVSDTWNFVSWPSMKADVYRLVCYLSPTIFLIPQLIKSINRWHGILLNPFLNIALYKTKEVNTLNDLTKDRTLQGRPQKQVNRVGIHLRGHPVCLQMKK